MTDNKNIPRLEHVKCDLCGSSDSSPEFEKDGYHGVRCSNCGLVFINPRPDAAYLEEEVYSADYFDAKKGYGIEDAFGAGRIEAKQRAERLFKKIEKKMKPGSVLDVGCASGAVLETAHSRGWNVKGSEISDHAATFARKEVGLDVITGDFTELDLPQAGFDLVLMLDVIEHFRSPAAALKKAAHTLKPGGMLVLNTPNYDSAPARALGTGWGLIAPEHHLFYFTPRTMREMVENAGFEKLSIQFPSWGLTDLITSAGSFSKAGVTVGDEQKQFVKKYLRGPRDIARSITTTIDRSIMVPFTKTKTGSIISLFAFLKD